MKKQLSFNDSCFRIHNEIYDEREYRRTIKRQKMLYNVERLKNSDCIHE